MVVSAEYSPSCSGMASPHYLPNSHTAPPCGPLSSAQTRFRRIRHTTQTRRCGWTNLGGAPDNYLGSFATSPLTITANQDIHPYLFGPWFASVIPVFPITWLVEAFIDDDLSVDISGRDAGLSELGTATFIARVGSTNISPTSVKASEHFVSLIFPVEDSEAKEFVLVATLKGETLFEVPFKRTARWAWTQWSLNC